MKEALIMRFMARTLPVQQVKPLLKVVALVVQNLAMTIAAHAKAAPKVDGSMIKSSPMERVKGILARNRNH